MSNHKATPHDFIVEALDADLLEGGDICEISGQSLWTGDHGYLKIRSADDVLGIADIGYAMPSQKCCHSFPSAGIRDPFRFNSCRIPGLHGHDMVIAAGGWPHPNLATAFFLGIGHDLFPGVNVQGPVSYNSFGIGDH